MVNITETIELISLGKQFVSYDTSRQVLAEVNVTLSQGEVYFVCGLNGSGKTTLLKILAGLIDPDAGSIILVRQRQTTSADRRRLSLYVPQNIDDAFVDNIFVYEYADVFGRNAILEAARAIDANWLIDLIEKKQDILIGELSQGQRQLLLVLTLMEQKAKVLLLDEIFASIDFKYHSMLWPIIERRVREKAVFAMLISHDTNFICGHATKGIVLYDGKVSFAGNIQQLTNSQLDNMIRTGER
jgi:energy-coupling factor transport system ATP-binding protein